MEMPGEIHIFHRLAADFNEGVALGAVTGEDRCVDAQVARLFGQQSIFSVVVGGVDDVRLSGLNRGKLSREILVSGLDVGGGNDLSSILNEVLHKIIPQADTVILGNIDDHRGGLRLQFIAGKTGRHFPLKRIDEARSKGDTSCLG